MTTKLINEIQQICKDIKLELGVNNSSSIKNKEFIQKITQAFTDICQDIASSIFNKTFIENAVDQQDKLNIIETINSSLVNLEADAIQYNHQHSKNRFTDKFIHSITYHHKKIDAIIQHIKTSQKNQELLSYDSDGIAIAKIFNCFKLEIPIDFKHAKELIKTITSCSKKNKPAELKVVLINYGLCDNNDQADKIAKQLVRKFFVPTNTDKTQLNQTQDEEKQEICRSLDFLKG